MAKIYIACLVAHCCHFAHVAHVWAWMGPIPLDLVFLDQEFMRSLLVRIFFGLAPKGPCSNIELRITSISFGMVWYTNCKLQVYKLQITSNIAGFWTC